MHQRLFGLDFWTDVPNECNEMTWWLLLLQERFSKAAPYMWSLSVASYDAIQQCFGRINCFLNLFLLSRQKIWSSCADVSFYMFFAHNWSESCKTSINLKKKSSWNRKLYKIGHMMLGPSFFSNFNACFWVETNVKKVTALPSHTVASD